MGDFLFPSNLHMIGIVYKSGTIGNFNAATVHIVPIHGNLITTNFSTPAYILALHQVLWQLSKQFPASRKSTPCPPPSLCLQARYKSKLTQSHMLPSHQVLLKSHNCNMSDEFMSH